MQARTMRNPGMAVLTTAGGTATLMHHASAPSLLWGSEDDVSSHFTVGQRCTRYGLTALAIASASALFATTIGATLH